VISPARALEREIVDSYDEWTVADIFAVLQRRRRIVYASVAAFLLLVTAYCLVAKPRYQAIGQIEIQKEPSDAFGLDSSVFGGEARGASDPLDYSMTLETQASILESDTLALDVIRSLALETSDDYFPVHKKGVALPSGLFFWRKPVEPLSIPLENAPNRRYVALRIFAHHLRIQPVTGTRIVEIRYSDPDPKQAAEVVNHLIGSLADYTFQARLAQTAQSSSWLAGQMAGLKKQAETLQARAITLQREAGMYGEDGSHNVVLARLEDLNRSLTEAESNRILKEAIYRATQSGDPELISGLGGNAPSGAMAGVQNSLDLIQNLRAQESSAKAALAQDETRYGSAWPGMAERRAQLGDIQNSIHEEVQRLGERARTDYEIAESSENAARDQFEKQKTQAGQLNGSVIAWTLARQEADASRNLYDQLLGKLKQAGVLEGLHASNFTIVSPARTPPTNHPKSPNVPLYYAAALGAGLFFGCAGALTRELTDRSITSLAEVERLLGIPLLSVIPLFEVRFVLSRLFPGGRRITGRKEKPPSSWEQQTLGAPDSSFSESLRTLRASLMLSRSSMPPQVVLVTSAGAGEGKSTVALNLAVVLAQQGSRVLLVDADLRNPALHRLIGVAESPGLSAALASDSVQPGPYLLRRLPTLALLCAGRKPPFPSELIASRRMEHLLVEWRAEYDFIVLDSPPALPISDALVLSQMADATLLVARPGVTAKQAILRSYRALSLQIPQNAVLGVVLNGVRGTSADYFEYYGYRGHSYGSLQA
jgi:capsular exopolysaccharide synthesis family protein